MAEALAVIGLVSSIVQFVDFGTKVIRRFQDFQERVGDVPAVFKNLKTRLPLLVDILKRIEDDVQKGRYNQATQRALIPVVQSSRDQVEQLNDFLGKVLPGLEDSSWRRGTKAWLSVGQESKIQKIEEALAENIQLLTIHQVTSPRLDEGKSITKLYMVPFERDHQFINRRDILDEIDRNFSKRKRVALAGLGGVGKTQIAIEYCYLFKERSPEASVFWIHSTTDRFTQAYREIATRLNVPGHDSIERDTIKLVTDWLSDERSGQWLMVLDNADDSSLFFPNRSAPIRNDKDVKLLAQYLPRGSTGSILVTTRDSKLGERLCNREKSILVHTMQMHEAEALLRSKIADEMSCEDGSKELLDELAFLPLAITQAAAFISENQISVRGYLEILRMSDRDMQELLSEDLEDPRRDLETDNSVIRTWKISFDHILVEDPRAADILSLMAVLERSGVPIFLLRQADETETSFAKALGTLQAFSLITGDRGKSSSFRMHRLVQFATQRWLDIRGKLSEWQTKATAAVAKFYPVDTGLDTWPICEFLAPHAQLVLSYKCDACSSQEARRQRGVLLSKKCVYEYDMGRFQNAYIEGKEGFDILTELCGEDDPDVLRCYNNMGVWLSSQGQLNESKAFLEKAVAGNEKVLGIDHSETRKSLLNLSMILQRLEEYEEAEKLIQKVLERQSKLLGPDAAPTLITQQWIAAVWKAKGDLEASEKLLRRIRQGLEITCGPEDPATLDCLKELAVILKLEGKLEEAVSLLRIVVAAWEKQSGPTAALTLGGIVLLADCISAMGDHVAAEKVIRDALVRETTLSGEESPTNIMLLNQIGVLQNKQCHHEQAEETFLKVIAQEEKFFGKENSNTMISTMSLAYAIEKIAFEMNRPERYVEVERLYRYVLEICERTRGLRSDEAIDCRKRLHTLLETQGKHEEAAAVMKGFE